MTINKLSGQILIIATAYLLCGCYSIGIYPENTVKKIADALEAVPIGTPLAQMNQEAGLKRLNFQKPTSALVSPIVCLSIDPLRKGSSDLCFYRQFPKGILLRIVEEDLKGEVGVAEKIDDTGRVVIYYDREYRFKGYFAYSSVRYSNDGDRLGVEKESFRALGMEDLSQRCRKWAMLVGSGPEKEKTIPPLPLSQYIRK